MEKKNTKEVTSNNEFGMEAKRIKSATKSGKRANVSRNAGPINNYATVQADVRSN